MLSTKALSWHNCNHVSCHDRTQHVVTQNKKYECIFVGVTCLARVQSEITCWSRYYEHSLFLCEVRKHQQFIPKRTSVISDSLQIYRLKRKQTGLHSLPYVVLWQLLVNLERFAMVCYDLFKEKHYSYLIQKEMNKTYLVGLKHFLSQGRICFDFDLRQNARFEAKATAFRVFRYFDKKYFTTALSNRFSLVGCQSIYS